MKHQAEPRGSVFSSFGGPAWDLKFLVFDVATRCSSSCQYVHIKFPLLTSPSFTSLEWPVLGYLRYNKRDVTFLNPLTACLYKQAWNKNWSKKVFRSQTLQNHPVSITPPTLKLFTVFSLLITNYDDRNYSHVINFQFKFRTSIHQITRTDCELKLCGIAFFYLYYHYLINVYDLLKLHEVWLCSL